MLNWIPNVEFFTLLITIIGGFFVLYGKIERKIESLDSKIESKSQRTDLLYEMFIDLLKGNK